MEWLIIGHISTPNNSTSPQARGSPAVQARRPFHQSFRERKGCYALGNPLPVWRWTRRRQDPSIQPCLRTRAPRFRRRRPLLNPSPISQAALHWCG